MTKKTDSISGSPHDARRACRVSYTLNNDQPVRSTIIGDQPLFYMDFDGPLDDGTDDFIFDTLAGDVEQPERMAIPCDRFSPDFGQPGELRMQEFLAGSSEMLNPAPADRECPDVEEMRRLLCKSRFAQALLEHADENGIAIAFSDQVETSGYDRNASVILVNRNLGSADRLLLAVRELRRVWQHRQGVLVHPLTFYPDQAILVNRAQMADLAVAIVRAAWEFQLADDKEPWMRIENSPMSDLGRVFAREAFVDFRTLNNGTAAAAVFETWFLSERCRKQDKILIQQMLADYQGYVFSNEQSSRAVTAEMITGLGTMPFGKNYLASHAAAIMNDPVFTEVRDRSNANFLWFIKFEKSFRETEQELQQGTGLPGHGMRHDLPVTSSCKDKDHEKTASIVAIGSYRAEPEPSGVSKKTGRRTGTGASVLRFPSPGSGSGH